MKACPNCGTNLPVTAKFCINCGSPQPTAAPEESFFQPGEELGNQIVEQFFPALQRRVEEELHAELLPKYSERLYASGFRDTLHRRAQMLGERLSLAYREGTLETEDIPFWIEDLYEELLDFFVLRFCGDLNEFEFPQAILRYQQQSWESIDLFAMIMDYLAFEQEEETVYTNFLTMPVDKLRNASRSFLSPDKQEKILFICDKSILGSCREGFAMTELGLYWRAPLEKKRKVLYRDIQSIKRHKGWITINDHFFNLNPRFDIKMLKLLKKIDRLLRRPI